MTVDSPKDLTTEFLDRTTDGRFEEIDELTHSAGPFSGTGELLSFASVVLTNLLLRFALGGVPTEITRVAVVEREDGTAEVEAEVEVVGLVVVEWAVKARTEEAVMADGAPDEETWRIWDVDVSL